MDTVCMGIQFNKINYYDESYKKIKSCISVKKVIMMDHYILYILFNNICVLILFELTCKERNAINICILSKYYLEQMKIVLHWNFR